MKRKTAISGAGYKIYMGFPDKRPSHWARKPGEKGYYDKTGRWRKVKPAKKVGCHRGLEQVAQDHAKGLAYKYGCTETIDEMRARHEREIAELQDSCPHPKKEITGWEQLYWAIGHSLPIEVRVCNICGKHVKTRKMKMSGGKMYD